MSSETKIVPKRTVVDFPGTEIASEEENRHVMTEATRLANLAPGEWRLWIDGSAERLSVPRTILQEIVEAVIRDKEEKARKAQAELRRQDARVEKQRNAARRDEERKREREQRRIEKDTERKGKEKNRAFTTLIKLPSEQHEAKLAALAKRLGEELSALRDEFSEFAAESTVTPPVTNWHVDPWHDPVATVALLQELIIKIRKHIVAQPHEVLAIVLWVLMAWIHGVAATHSPYLVATSAEPDSGKSTLLGVLGFLVPKPFTGAEPTGPSVYRFVDCEKPTLLVDEADDLFQRKSDVKHIFNVGWTRGTKIPRQVQVQGVSTTVWFDPFCPKVVGLLGTNVPRALMGRCIVIKLWPKKADEKIEDFSYTDDKEFAKLRRKLARWSADNAAAIRKPKPRLPENFNNRLAANWHLLLAIAELADGTWPRRAREAAERLSGTARRPSWGVQLLQAFGAIFATGRREVTSQEVVDAITADPTSQWVEYNRGGPITQRQVAHLLEPYDIFPVAIHPTKRSTVTRRGYQSRQFEDAFSRYVPRHPHIRTR
jgi:putative DNA primase/helicase